MYYLHQMQVISIPLGQAPLVRPAKALPPVAVSLLDLQARTADAAALLKALAHPDRLMMLWQRVGGERSVNELGALAGVGQPLLSQQLGLLRGERLVTHRREGKHGVYRIASPRRPPGPPGPPLGIS